MACAYHAGQGEVRGWLSDPGLSGGRCDAEAGKPCRRPDPKFPMRGESDEIMAFMGALLHPSGKRLLTWLADAGAGLLRGSVR